MAYGLTDAGFSRPTFQEIRAELEEDCRVELGIPDLILQGGKWGRFIDVLASREDVVWQALQTVNDSRRPAGARGVALDDVLALTGSRRGEATKSEVGVRLVGTAGTVVSAGFVVAVVGTGTRFATLLPVTLVASPAWASSTAYAVGAQVARTGNVYEATVGGVSGLSGPTGTGAAFVDGGVTWKWLGVGTGVGLVDAQAEAYGPLPATAGTVTQLVTTVAGVTAVSNPEDAVLGSNRENDAAARLRRENELTAPGAGTLDALRGKLLRVGRGTLNPVRDAVVFENTGDIVNGDGLPAHSFEAVVDGGEDADVAQAVWDAKPLGIYSHGTTPVTVEDAAGNPQVVRITRPTTLALYVSLTVEKGEDWPVSEADEDALVEAIKASVASYNAQLSLGEKARRAFLFELARAGLGDNVVSDVPALTLGTAPSPVGTANVTPGSRQVVRLDTSRVVVTLV